MRTGDPRKRSRLKRHKPDSKHFNFYLISSMVSAKITKHTFLETSYLIQTIKKKLSRIHKKGSSTQNKTRNEIRMKPQVLYSTFLPPLFRLMPVLRGELWDMALESRDITLPGAHMDDLRSPRSSVARQ